MMEEEEDIHLSPLLTAAKLGEVATFKSLLQNGFSDVLEADKVGYWIKLLRILT